MRPKKIRKSLTIGIHPRVYDQLVKISAKQDRSITSTVRIAISYYLAAISREQIDEIHKENSNDESDTT